MGMMNYMMSRTLEEGTAQKADNCLFLRRVKQAQARNLVMPFYWLYGTLCCRRLVRVHQ